MKQKIIMSLVLLFLLALQTGCGADDTVYLERMESGTELVTEHTEGDTEQNAGESPVSGKEQSAAGYEVQETAADPTGLSGKEDIAGDSRKDCPDEEICYVYVCGAVCVPGVYALKQGSRIYEALAMAGGLTEDASAASVNQAEPVRDGQMIYMPTEEEIQEGIVLPEGNRSAADGTSPEDAAGSEGNSDSGANVDICVNLNTATTSELMTLPGIGQTKAERILAYREKHGGFSSVEEIMNVDGIKEGVYNRIKDNIRVK